MTLIGPRMVSDGKIARYRMDAFEGLLAKLKSRLATWFARGTDILD